MRKAVQEGLIGGFTVANLPLQVSHLQFANDTLIFCDASEEHVKNVKAILLCFEAVSGLKINFKSELIRIRVGDSFLSRCADLLGCKVESLPASYLGLPFMYRIS